MPSVTYDLSLQNYVTKTPLTTTTTSTSFVSLDSATLSGVPIKPVIVTFNSGSIYVDGTTIQDIEAHFQIKRGVTVIATFKLRAKDLTVSSNKIMIPASSISTTDFTPSGTTYSIEYKVTGASMTAGVDSVVFSVMELI